MDNQLAGPVTRIASSPTAEQAMPLPWPAPQHSSEPSPLCSCCGACEEGTERWTGGEGEAGKGLKMCSMHARSVSIVHCECALITNEDKLKLMSKFLLYSFNSRLMILQAYLL